MMLDTPAVIAARIEILTMWFENSQIADVAISSDIMQDFPKEMASLEQEIAWLADFDDACSVRGKEFDQRLRDDGWYWP